MAAKEFPTDFSDLASVDLDTTLLGDDGSVNGLLTVGDIIGLGAGGSGVTMVKIDEHEVTGSAVTTHSFSGLDGNVDGSYRIVMRVKNTVGSSIAMVVRPNADSTGYSYQFVRGNNASVTAGSGALSGLSIAQTLGSGLWGFADFTMQAKTGAERRSYTIRSSQASATDIDEYTHVDGMWHDNSSNITSLDIVALTANGLGVGTVIELWAERTVGNNGAINMNNTPTGAYTLVEADLGKLVTIDAGLTIPTGLSVGFHCRVFLDNVTKQTLTTTGVTTKGGDVNTSISGDGTIEVTIKATDTALITGDMEA